MQLEASNLVDLLRERADGFPARTAFCFLADGETESESITYAQLDRRARDLAIRLRNMGADGQPILLMFPAGLDFIVAFFGCLYASSIAVPCHPPRGNQRPDRLLAIARNAGAQWALTSAELLLDVENRGREEADLSNVRWMALPASAGLDTSLWKSPSVSEKSIALLQYTSGSTGEPKGVMLTHGNLIHNERMVKAAFRHGPETVVAGWLPQFHDMGLIGNILQPVFMGVPCILMPPMAFLQRPVRWLRMISDHRATTSGGPNFAYELCVRKVTKEQLQGIDLSSWALAFSGAEPVRAQTLDLFASRFASHGFRRQAFYPCYGLAEATLFVAGPKPGQPTRILRALRRSLAERRVVQSLEPQPCETVETLVGCGSSDASQNIAIVNPDLLTRCAPGEVGEIWVSGPSIAAGYWRMCELNAHTFEARLTDAPDHRYLRTGDLGVFVDEQLFVCGRLKDLIIVRGRNHAPEDIEWSASQVLNGCSAGSSAAFSVRSGDAERLVLVQEIDRKALRSAGEDALAAQLRRVIAHEHGLQLSDVVFVKLASVPRTSSGKVQRHQCRVLYEADMLSRLHFDAAEMASVHGSASLPTRAGATFRERLDEH